MSREIVTLHCRLTVSRVFIYFSLKQPPSNINQNPYDYHVEIDSEPIFIVRIHNIRIHNIIFGIKHKRLPDQGEKT